MRSTIHLRPRLRGFPRLAAGILLAFTFVVLSPLRAADYTITAGTAENPVLITNLGGQFVIDTTTTDKGLYFYNCRHFILRGTPSPGNCDYGMKIARVSQETSKSVEPWMNARPMGGAFVRPGHPLHHKVAHIDQNIAHVGRSGIDQLVALIDRREHGVPVVANVLMVEGAWIPGATVRVLR